jgi:hypothetical protein
MVAVVALLQLLDGGIVTGILVRFPSGHEAVIPLRRRARRVCAAPGCGGDLSGRRPQTRYCGPRCRVAAHRAREGDGRAAKPLQGPSTGENTRPAAVTVSWAALVADQLGDGRWRTP